MIVILAPALFWPRATDRPTTDARYDALDDSADRARAGAGDELRRASLAERKNYRRSTKINDKLPGKQMIV